MRKIILILLVLAITGGAVFADLLDYPPPLQDTKVLLDFGVGYALDWNIYGGTKMKVPPLFVSAEFCIPPVPISIGGFFAFRQYSWEGTTYDYYGWRYPSVPRTYEEKYTYMTFAARANWHWNIPVNWLDLYTGMQIGYQYFKWSTNYSGFGSYSIIEPSWGGIHWNIQAGAHFYFTKIFGVMVELGVPYLGKVGLSFKF